MKKILLKMLLSVSLFFICSNIFAQDNCNTDWFESVSSCGLSEYVTSNGTTIYATVPDPMIADTPTYYYDCEGNYLCEDGGYYQEDNLPPSHCSFYNGFGVGDLTFVQIAVFCENPLEINCNTDWFVQDEWGKCGLDKYVNEYGQTIFVSVGNPNAADYATHYYTCTGYEVCTLGGLMGPTTCQYINEENLTFLETVVECNDGLEIVCNTDWFEPNAYKCSLVEYVTNDGTTIFCSEPAPSIVGALNNYYDCEGNFLCSSGVVSNVFFFECSSDFGVDLNGLTYVQIAVACDESFGLNCNTDWYTPNADQCILDEYVNGQGATVYKTTPTEVPGMSNDMPIQYFDCEGNWLCSSNGEILPSWECAGAFLQDLSFVQNIYNCDPDCSTDWFESIYSCGLNEYVTSDGTTIYVTVPDPMIPDLSTWYYDCAGNYLCSTGGYYPDNYLPTDHCSLYNGFDVDDLTFVQTVVECSDLILIDDFSIQLRVLFEGISDGVNPMNTNLLDAGILPISQPFENTWNYNGSEQFYNQSPDIVDWVLVCLRDAEGNILFDQAAFVGTDGYLIDTQGVSGITFPNANPNETYYVSVHHPGHLSIMSTLTIADNTTYDFTTSQDMAMGIEPMKEVNGSFVMFGGDFDGNGNINSLDFNAWYNDSAAVNQYLSIDVDGNGLVNNLDYNVWELNRSKIGLPILND